MLAPLVAVLLAAGPSDPAPKPAAKPVQSRVAVMPLEAGNKVDKDVASAFTDSVAAEVQKVPGVRVITQSDIQALLSLEKQKKMFGCSEDASCLAEIGGALGVEYLVVGNVARLGSSWLMFLKVIDVKKVSTVSRADTKGANEDALLETIPRMIEQMFPNRGYSAKNSIATRLSAPPPAAYLQPETAAGGGPAGPKKSYRAAWWMIGGGLGLAVAGAVLATHPWQSADEFQERNGMRIYKMTAEEAKSINKVAGIGTVGAGVGVALAGAGFIWRVAF